jgi:hypothetical protein
MSARDTYNASVATAQTQLAFTGFTGQGSAPSPLSSTNVTQEYPSIQTLKAYLALGTIPYSQFVQLANATNMYAQTQVRAARDVLVNSGDLASA